MGRVKINTGRPYEVIIEEGLLAQIALHLQPWYGRQLFLLTDDRVGALYGDAVVQKLAAAGWQIQVYCVPPGEESKSMETLAKVLEAMAQSGLHRDGLLLALGGGVVGDLGGYAAAAFLRGIDFIQLPTTLLACVDSSVGGKTAVNLKAGKNLVGAFHQPLAVLADPAALSSLPEEVWADGMAEVIKYGVLFDQALFQRTAQGVSPQHRDLPAIIARCVELKAAVVAEDEKDLGQRQLLNLGHTFGHAIEQVSGYSVSHGQAVAAGMAMMARACQKRGLCTLETVQALEAALAKNRLPLQTALPHGELLAVAGKDKKAGRAGITLVVVRAIGTCSLHRVALADLGGWLEDSI